MLVAMIPIIGTQSFFSADEGAAVAQAQLLSNGDGWTTSHPFAAADPSGDAFPIELSARRGGNYAPFVKHPLYAVLLAGADKVGGRTAMVLLSVLGTWVAAVAVALLTARLAPGRGLEVLALWLTGLVSPLFFDAYVLIAHTLGAACVAIAALWFVRMLDRGVSWGAGAIVGLATVGAVLARTEGLLLALGLGVAALVVAVRRRDRSLVVLAVIPILAAGFAVLAEREWTKTIMGGASTQTQPLEIVTRSGGPLDHLRGFVITALLPSYRADTAAVLMLAIAALVVCAGVVIVRKPDDRQGPIVLLAAAVLAGVLRLFFVADPVSGLLIAFPVLLLAVVVGPWRELLADDRVVSLLVAAGVFGVLVTATQFTEGGAGEWGGRYFAIGLPLIVPVIAIALGRIPDLIDAGSRTTVAVLLAFSLLAFPVLAVRTLRSYHQFGDQLVTGLVAAADKTTAGDGGRPVVISSDGTTARFALDHLDGERFLTVDLDDVGAYAARLHDLGVRQLVFVTHDRKDLTRLPGYRVDTMSEPVGGWLVATLGSS